MTGWIIVSALAATAVVIAVLVARALRRASRHIDQIVDEELSPQDPSRSSDRQPGGGR